MRIQGETETGAAVLSASAGTRAPSWHSDPQLQIALHAKRSKAFLICACVPQLFEVPDSAVQFQLIPFADEFQSGLRFGGSSDFDAYEEAGCRSEHIVRLAPAS